MTDEQDHVLKATTVEDILRIARDSKAIGEIVVPKHQHARVFEGLVTGRPWRMQAGIYDRATWYIDVYLTVEDSDRIRVELRTPDGETVGVIIIRPAR